MSSDLDLPAEVRTQLGNGQIVRFVIDKPIWIATHARQVGTLTNVGASSSRPYVTCHVLLMREFKNKKQVLLSQRLTGYGKGTYTLPGGKQGPNESLQDCAARELREETGVRSVKSRPVSFHSTRFPGKPRVISVGVLVEEYNGSPKHSEPTQNTRWQWFDLDKLPVPLFGPARVAISHYVNDTYHGLQWSEVEDQVSALSEPIKQLELPIDL